MVLTGGWRLIDGVLYLFRNRGAPRGKAKMSSQCVGKNQIVRFLVFKMPATSGLSWHIFVSKSICTSVLFQVINFYVSTKTVTSFLISCWITTADIVIPRLIFKWSQVHMAHTTYASNWLQSSLDWLALIISLVIKPSYSFTLEELIENLNFLVVPWKKLLKKLVPSSLSPPCNYLVFFLKKLEWMALH